MRGKRNGREGDLSSTWTRPRETCLPGGREGGGCVKEGGYERSKSEGRDRGG